MNGLKKHHMTLLELLVSMAIFSVVMIILASMVYSVSQVTRRQQAQTDLYRDQRILMSVVTQDLQSLVVSNDTGEEISCAFLSAPQVSGDYEYAGAFISNSGLGVTPGTDTSFLAEVVYCRKISDSGSPITKDTPLFRYIVPASSSKWNFIGDLTPSWIDPFTDPEVNPARLATGVAEFKLEALDAAGAKLTSPTTTAPVVVTVTARFQDASDTEGTDMADGHATRVFTKRIFTKRGE